MENEQFFSPRPGHENSEKNSDDLSSQNSFVYPPKPEPENKKSNIWVRSITSLALYLLIGYYFFSANWILVLILTGIVIFHELGHFLAMKIYDYKELGIFFIPLLGAYASGNQDAVVTGNTFVHFTQIATFATAAVNTNLFLSMSTISSK